MTGPTVEIVDPDLATRTRSVLNRLVADGAAAAVGTADPTRWGAEAEAEAGKRLGWVRLPESSRPLLATVATLRRRLHDDGIDRVVLAGMGGSSLAPEVICGSAGLPLTVLDTTDPEQVADALAGELNRTVVVISSKSGSTVETDSHRRIFAAAFEKAGLVAGDHMVAVTDPGSPLQETARELGFRAVVAADPSVGGRYSALTAFGLVPSGLAGADIEQLLDDARAALPALTADDPDNPALLLASALAAAHVSGAEKVVLADTGSGIVGFGDWAEQLIAESTGKNGTGLLPVVVEGVDAPGFADAGSDATPVAVGPGTPRARIVVGGSLGAQFQLWEHAVALVGIPLGINPFDQPDVEAAKVAARELLSGSDGADGRPDTVDGDVEITVVGGWTDTPTDTSAALRALVGAAPAAGYLGVQAYLNRLDDASAALLRPELGRRSGLQTTFGWGPRFLHSTGQYHKGGHQNGVFLQITGQSETDLEVPGMPYTLATLQRAQAAGDGAVLAARGRPVLRLHFRDRAAGLVQVMRVVEGLS